MKLCAVIAATAMLLPSAAFAHQQSAVAATSSASAASLQLSQTTEAPGIQLSRGSYTIRIADRLQDRLIVQLQKSGSSDLTSLLAYPNPSLRGGSFTGPITFASGLKGKPTLRGYAFPGGPVVEFVFPKADAVDLAKGNAVRVMAVDTASEGKVNLPNLTQTDMSEVTLWMLTPTPVDPTTAKPGIQAARYQVPAAQTAVAQNTASPIAAPAPAPAVADAASTPAPQPATPIRSAARSTASAPAVVAANHPPRLRPDVKQLPHTASAQPLLALVALGSLLGAASLTLRRRLSSL